MKTYQLAAIDLDGTLFNNSGEVTSACRDAIRAATENGFHIVISTGRPLCGIPMDKLGDTGIRYAITANGAGLYDILTHECIHEETMSTEQMLSILSFLDTKAIHMDAFINGNAFSSVKTLPIARALDIPESLKRYIIHTRVRVSDLREFIRINEICVQKMTLNFTTLDDGTYRERDAVREYLESREDVQCVCGGYHNLEFTRRGVTKGAALLRLAGFLGVQAEQTIAIGDTENDLSIIEAAGLGVAMGNATDDVKAAAGYVTSSNEEDGVAKALRELLAVPADAPGESDDGQHNA